LAIGSISEKSEKCLGSKSKNHFSILSNGERMMCRGFEIFQNDTFAKIYSKHRNRCFYEIEGNKGYIIKGPIFGNIKFRSYLYHCKDSSEFLKRTIQLCKKKGIPILEIYTHYNLDEILSSKFKNFRVEQTYSSTYILDLKLSEDAIWKNMSKVCRQNIKKANNSDIKIRDTKNMNDFDTWWEIYKLTGSRGQFVKQRYEMVKEVFESEEISKLFVAIVDDKIVAGAFILIHKIPVWWLGGSLPEFWKFMPNNLIQWEIIRWAIKERYPFYDFGGATRENEGPSEFKRKFGGEYKENHIYTIILKPFKSKIINKLIQWRYSLSKQH
jgi:lipid II:glycine glycyltransferase (peptidoglycan interpeptide bridge formation enzyme)